MPKFKYKFESIKNIKENLEKKAQKEVAVIDAEIAVCKAEYGALNEEEIISRKNFKMSGVLAGELKFKKNFEISLKKKKDAVLEKIGRLEEKKKKKVEELVQKTKEHKIFESLEDTYRENFNFEQNKIELGQIDEIATQKFIRQNK